MRGFLLSFYHFAGPVGVKKRRNISQEKRKGAVSPEIFLIEKPLRSSTTLAVLNEKQTQIVFKWKFCLPGQSGNEVFHDGSKSGHYRLAVICSSKLNIALDEVRRALFCTGL